MRLHNLGNSEFEGEGFGETARPQIANKNNAKIFYMLTSGFYSRPRESMFREYCANAYDEARHASRPFMVVLPHRLQPELIIRDWGRGMTHDFVMQRAMSLGDSTKDNDDEAIGGFGLGMKTAFCVTEQFSLVIYRGDHKQTYVIDLEGGTPRPMTDASMIEALEGEEQCTGTEVRIPIPEKDWSEFRDIAARILRLFPSDAYELHGATVDAPSYAMETASYAVLSQSSAPTYARMGCIAYRLDLEALFGDAWQEMNAPATGLELRFPIGALTVTPNREALLLDDVTRQSVREALFQAMEDFKKAFEADIQTAATYWEAWLLFAKKWAGAGDARRFLPERVRWQNERWGAVLGKFETPPVITSWACEDLRRYKSPRPMTRDKLTWEASRNHHYSRDFKPWAFVLDDLEAGKPKLYCQRAREVVKDIGYGDATRVAFVDQEFCDALELEPDFLASEYEPEKQARGANGFLRGKIRAFNSGRTSYKTASRWTLTEIDVLRGGLYIPFKGAHPLTPGSTAVAECVQWLDGATVWGVPRKTAKALDPALWRNALDVCREKAGRVARSRLLAPQMQWEALTRSIDYRRAAFVALLQEYRPACPVFGAMKDKLQALKPRATLKAKDLEYTRKLYDAGLLSDADANAWAAANDAPLPFDLDTEIEEFLHARPVFAEIYGDASSFARRGAIKSFFRAMEIVQ